MLNIGTISKIVVSLSVVVILCFHLNNVFTNYETKILGLNKEVLELNEYIDDLTEYIQNTPDTVVIPSPQPKTRTIVKGDTIRIVVEVDPYQIDSTLTVPFDLVDKQAGSFVQLKGYTIMKWSVRQRKYELVETVFTHKLINLNVTADYAVEGSNLNLNLLNSSALVNITYIDNNLLDLSKVHVAERSRWGFGVVGGLGLVNTGVTPFLGVGITYQFKDISFIK